MQTCSFKKCSPKHCTCLNVGISLAKLNMSRQSSMNSHVLVSLPVFFSNILVFFDISVFEPTADVKICKFTVFSSGSFCQIYRVTDEALRAETMVWPNFFPINVFFALKGSKLFIIISYHCSWMLCHVAAVKSLPVLIYSADYILLLVL